MLLSKRLPPDLREGSNDLGIYRETGEAVLRGGFPYRDFFLEYPPGSIPAFIPPALLSDTRSGFIDLFSSEMALALAAALVLVALTARGLGGYSAWPVPALTFAAGALLLYPVAVTRYDAVVALALAAAAFAGSAGGRHGVAAHASVGFAAAAKLVPGLAILPLLFMRWKVPGLAAFFGVVAVFFVPALFLGGAGLAESLGYHADRGLQVESVAASVLMAAGQPDGVVFEFGAFEVRGAGVVASLSLPLTAVLVGVTGFLAYRASRRGTPDGASFSRWAAALILAFMLGSKVLSPQYIVWLLPLAPLCASGLAGAGLCVLFLAVCFTTTQVFPVHYADLLNGRPPGPELLLVRNALLFVLWVSLLLPWGERARGASA